MKIAIVVEHLDGGEGGTLARWVALEMARRGHEVHVLCHDVGARVHPYRQATLRASFDAHRSRRAHGGAVEGNPEIGDPGVRVHRLGGMRLKTALGLRLFGARARAWCRRGVGGGRFDVVHSITVACPGDIYHAAGGVYAAMQAQAAAMRGGEAGRRWKRLLQRMPGKQRTMLALERRAMAGAQRVISPSAMVTEQLKEHYAVAAGRVVTLATPRLEGTGDKEKEEMREWFRGHYGIGAKDRVALFVGHDFRRKGLRQALEAVGRTTDWKLVVVGLGKVREYVELAQRLGLATGGDGGQGDRETGRQGDGGSRVMFVGPTKEMEAVYAAGDALLLPTFYEVSNAVVLEALGHGLPVVSTVYLGMAEVVRAARVGRIVEDPRDAGALAEALEGLPGAGSAEGLALARRARAAAAGFGVEGYAERVAELYREVGGDVTR